MIGLLTLLGNWLQIDKFFICLVVVSILAFLRSVRLGSIDKKFFKFGDSSILSLGCYLMKFNESPLPVGQPVAAKHETRLRGWHGPVVDDATGHMFELAKPHRSLACNVNALH